MGNGHSKIALDNLQAAIDAAEASFKSDRYGDLEPFRLRDITIKMAEITLFVSFLRVTRFKKPQQHEISLPSVKGTPTFQEWTAVRRIPPDQYLKFELYRSRIQKEEALLIFVCVKRDLLEVQEFLECQMEGFEAMGDYSFNQIRKWEK